MNPILARGTMFFPCGPRFAIALLAIGLCVFCPRATAQGEIAGWGSVVFNSTWHDETFVQVAAGPLCQRA
jgi:hypothetical protein